MALVVEIDGKVLRRARYRQQREKDRIERSEEREYLLDAVRGLYVAEYGIDAGGQKPRASFASVSSFAAASGELFVDIAAYALTLSASCWLYSAPSFRHRPRIDFTRKFVPVTHRAPNKHSSRRFSEKIRRTLINAGF